MKYDRYGFAILEDEEPIDYTSTDFDDGDMNTEDRPWWKEDGVSYDDETEDMGELYGY